MNDELPQGWINTCISDIATTQSGGTPSTIRRDYWEGGDVPWINSGALKDAIISSPSTCITRLGLENSSAKVFPRKTVVIALTGATTGRVGLLNFATSTNQSVTGILPSSAFVPEYLFYYLRLARDAVLAQVIGSAQPHINKQIVDELQIPISPIEEQQRIVNKLKGLLEKVDESQERLAKIPTFLKRFRQSVLVIACRGDLVKEKAKIVLLGDLEPKIQTGPFGSSLHKSDYIRAGVPIVNPMHIVSGRIVPSENTTVSNGTYQRLQSYALKKGDVIIARRGEMGRCAVVDSKSEGFLCGTGSLFVRINENIVDPNYLQLIISSPTTVAFLLERSVGTTMANLNQDILKDVEFPLPSVSIQRRIVTMVHKWFDMADKVEARYQKAQAQVDKLTLSILAKAFRGELVPQDPNDEPASKLLEKIKKANRA